jgi:hypothetical protein
VEEQPLDGACLVAEISHRFREFEVRAGGSEFQDEEGQCMKLLDTSRCELGIARSDEAQ